MKQFGICPIRSTCLDRHVLKELDKPPEFIPKLVNFNFKLSYNKFKFTQLIRVSININYNEIKEFIFV